jgi:predicted TIM-barrel fold metal-dependent hydrolase
MSGFAAFPGRDVRARVDHPVIDSDAHVVECRFAVMDFLKEIMGNDAEDRLAKTQWAVRQYNQPSKFLWWGVPSGENTGDRAMAMLPKYFRSQMDEMGLDFAHLYTTTGIPGLYIQDNELRQAYCRALNMLSADMFKDVGDRMRPVAVIPTFTPEEAIEELKFAVTELGHKAIMVGTEIITPVDGAGDEAPFRTGSIAIDPPYDYDPFWQKCLDLKVAPVGHTAAIGNAYRNSTSNYVFNHLGSFGVGGEYFARALFLGGVTRRFPTLSFGFLEGGVSWALNLLNDIVEHFEKRNVDHLENYLDPNKVDVELLVELFEEFGNDYLTGERIREQPNGALSRKERPNPFNEFEACGMTEVNDLQELFVDRFYFGCEADDRMTSIAFTRRLNPIGKELNAVFGSDIGHWDVMDAKSILSEAWSLVEAKLISEENFRDLTFTNPAMLHLSVNPDYFKGTVLEDNADKLLQSRGSV